MKLEGKNLKNPTMAFNICIFMRKLFLLCHLYLEIRMDRETEASDAQKKQELLKNAENTAERRRKISGSASIGTYGSFALNATA